jgi:quinol---cytochrome c reductase iron-sulfur subunit
VSEGEVFEREARSSPRAELLVAALLGATAVLAIAFVVALFARSHDTQLLGATLAGALGTLAAALIVAAKRVVPREQALEERPRLSSELQPVKWRLTSIGEGVSRRRLLALAAAAAGTSLAAAAAAPITALGPAPRQDTPWRKGRRLVDDTGEPLTAADIAPGSFVTAFPEGADKRELGSPVVLVREDPAKIEVRRGWAPQGILAYSKICTHAGCAIALYRTPSYEPTSERPALECPCHYSTFDTRTGGKVTAGPAGRPLPQLPLRIGPNNELQAAGTLSGSVGPAWWNVKR